MRRLGERFFAPLPCPKFFRRKKTSQNGPSALAVHAPKG
jgi:hypothetical protein